MNTKISDSTPVKFPLKSILIAGLVTAAAGFGALYVNLGADGNDTSASNAESGKPAGKVSQGLKAYSKGQMITFVARSVPKDLPAFTFVKDDGSQTSLEDWRGKVVLLNLWATWCAPCRKEMPMLDQLKADLGGDDFDLVALSIDRGGLEKPGKFLKEIGVKNLKLYNSPSGKLASSLKVFGMPTTILLNREGKEIGRMVGPAEWDSPDAVALIKAAIADKG